MYIYTKAYNIKRGGKTEVTDFITLFVHSHLYIETPKYDINWQNFWKWAFHKNFTSSFVSCWCSADIIITMEPRIMLFCRNFIHTIIYIVRRMLSLYIHTHRPLNIHIFTLFTLLFQWNRLVSSFFHFFLRRRYTKAMTHQQIFPRSMDLYFFYFII